MGTKLITISLVATMLCWMKGLSASQTRAGKPRNRGVLSIKRRRSTASLSLLSDAVLETSKSLDLGDTFSTSKDWTIFGKNKQISKRIISMFQRKPKDVSRDDNGWDRSTDSLLDESTENAMDQETEERSFLNEEMKGARRRYAGTVKRVFSLKRKKKQLKRAPLDDYAKRKLQISRDLGWERTSSASSSLSSLVNEEGVLSASSPFTKVNPKKSPRMSPRLKPEPIAVRRKMLLLCWEEAENLLEQGSSVTEDPKELVDDNSSGLSDSGICENSDSSNLSDSSEHSGSTADIVDKLRVMKLSHSEDCLAHLLADVKSCSKCAPRCDAARSRRRTRANGSPAKVSSRIANHSEELRAVKSVGSADCISTYTRSPLKSASIEERSPDAATCSRPNRLGVDNRSDLLGYRRSIEKLPTRSWLSKSATELHQEDPLCCEGEIAEFCSLNDLPTSLRRSGSVDEARGKNRDGASVDERSKLTLDEENVTGGMTDLCDSSSFDCEDELDDESRYFGSLNASYVLTMYV